MRVMLDTCIIVDGIHGREPFCQDTMDIFSLAGLEKFDGFITAKSVTDIYYLTHKALHSSEKTRKIIDNLLQVFYVADTTAADCRNALLSDTADFEDAIMIATAGREKMDCIVTRNAVDYRLARIPIYTPREFLTLMGRLNESTQEGSL